jgi:hypothetical protein
VLAAVGTAAIRAEHGFTTGSARNDHASTRVDASEPVRRVTSRLMQWPSVPPAVASHAVLPVVTDDQLAAPIEAVPFGAPKLVDYAPDSSTLASSLREQPRAASPAVLPRSVHSVVTDKRSPNLGKIHRRGGRTWPLPPPPGSPGPRGAQLSLPRITLPWACPELDLSESDGRRLPGESERRVRQLCPPPSRRHSGRRGAATPE